MTNFTDNPTQIMQNIAVWINVHNLHEKKKTTRTTDIVIYIVLVVFCPYNMRNLRETLFA